jgi:hypothetical protein
LFLVITLLSGCSNPQNAPPPPITKVKGKVNLDGKPMADGEIRFMVAGQGPKITAIKDGTFSGEAFVGKNQVDVVLEKDGPPSTTDPKILTKVNLVDDIFSGPKTTLSAEVTKDGANDFNFEVFTKSP